LVVGGWKRKRKREICTKRPDRDRKSLESGGRREKGLSLSLSLSFPRVGITCCNHTEKDEDSETAVLLTDDPHRRGIEEVEEGNPMEAK